MAKANRKRTTARRTSLEAAVRQSEKRQLTPKQKRVRLANLEKARKARAEKAVKLAEERMESPPQPKSLRGTVFMSDEAITDREKLSENGKAFVDILNDYEESVRVHESRGGGDPDEVEAKERDYRFLKEVILSFRHVIY